MVDAGKVDSQQALPGGLVSRRQITPRPGDPRSVATTPAGQVTMILAEPRL